MGWYTAQVGNGQQVIVFIIPQEQLNVLCNAQKALLGYQIKTKNVFQFRKWSIDEQQNYGKNISEGSWLTCWTCLWKSDSCSHEVSQFYVICISLNYILIKRHAIYSKAGLRTRAWNDKWRGTINYLNRAALHLRLQQNPTGIRPPGDLWKGYP